MTPIVPYMNGTHTKQSLLTNSTN
ncbi:hypothetical protein CBM2592_B10081 [Cupriavidus taiwanensis]|nr:hypothetical protein CBM2592_B10081 [Cupriavidus taiwanensis]SOZ73519.1 hypothetical protein CBM2617_B190082 [Cupriavidus taiwanensis]SOZ85957.1 hypothetical protein CBM2622_B10081 [Cupriavidus taiwanensis]SOZ92794.1 hypothetical protein CBM2621_B10081 [Cupriavidus taiwanensis]SPA20767.1 hypothetical protein CBM2631_B220081 [Cupriavidus taiwanensis]